MSRLNKLSLLFLVAYRDLVSSRLRTSIAITGIAFMVASTIIVTALIDSLTASVSSPSMAILFGEESLALAGIWLTLAILLLALLVIFSALTISVYGKTFNMTVWTAVGASPSDIITISISEAVAVGITGSLLGYFVVGLSLLVAKVFSMPTLSSLPSRLGLGGFMTYIALALIVSAIASMLPYVKSTRLGATATRMERKPWHMPTRKPFIAKEERLPIRIKMDEVEDLFLFVKSLENASTPSLRRFHNFWGVTTRKRLDGATEKALGFRCELTAIPDSFADVILTFRQSVSGQGEAEAYAAITPYAIYAGMASHSSLERITNEAKQGLGIILSKWIAESKREA